MIRRGSPWILQPGTPIPCCCHCFIDRPKDKTSDTEGVALDIAAGNPYSTLLPLFHRST